MGRARAVRRSRRGVAVVLALALTLPVTWLASVPAASDVTFVVNRTSDLADLNAGDGLCDTAAQTGNQCTLRAAIEEANATAGADTIAFNIGGAAVVKTLSPASPYPAITEAVTIDGYTQPGSTPNTLASGNDAVLSIQLNGTNAGADQHGLVIEADDSTVRGLMINRFGGDGVRLTGSGNRVEGNLIGSNSGGDLGNGGHGVSITAGSTNTIGGTTPAARNLISANDGSGVALTGAGTGNAVQGNYIGTNKAGNSALPNSDDGVRITGAEETVVGGAEPGAGNVISGNGVNGVLITTSPAPDTVIQGNFIGTNATGTAAVPNEGNGVTVAEVGEILIGGIEFGQGNLISGNDAQGVRIFGVNATGNAVQGNLIGTNAAGTAALGNGDDGVGISDAGPLNLIGGLGGIEFGQGNVISGNGEDGISVFGGGDNTIIGNFIGTNATGTGDLGNVRHGVSMIDSDANLVSALGASPNVISGNGADGVSITNSGDNIVTENHIGTNAAGNVDLGNADDGVSLTNSIGNEVGGPEAGNLISGNDGAGVELFGPASLFNFVQGNVIGLRRNANTVLGNGGPGVSVGQAASDTTIGGSADGEGNVISSNAVGVAIETQLGDDTVIQGNMIGTNRAGTADRGNLGPGIIVRNTGNLIGGVAPGAGNLISGNDDHGVVIEGSSATGNVLQGNFIGTTATGDGDLGNVGHGVFVHDSSGVTIGGAASGAGNLISGNARHGVALEGGSGNVVRGNRIGAAAEGNADLGNGGMGVFLNVSADNTIGGTGASGNVITGNDGHGVRTTSSFTTGNEITGNFLSSNSLDGVNMGGDGNTVAGNVIIANGQNGVEVSPGGQGNRILSNQIMGNTGLGIDLDKTGELEGVVTPNDNDDPDTGANQLQNFPVLTSATRSNSTGVTTIIGTLNSTPSQEFTIQFFVAAADPSGHGEAAFLFGTRNVITNANGDRGFVFATSALFQGQAVTTTATNITTGDTSEFSLNRPVLPGGP